MIRSELNGALQQGDIDLAERWRNGSSGWTPIVDAGGGWDPTTPCSILGNPALWDRYCVRVTHVAAGRSFAERNFSDANIRTIAFEFIVAFENIADGGVFNVLSTKHDSGGVNNLIGRFQVNQIAGVLYLIGAIVKNGNPADPDNIRILIANLLAPARYRVEFQWDLTHGIYFVWINGALVDTGFITGVALTDPWELTDVQPGGAVIDTDIAIHFQGPILMYRKTRLAGAWDAAFGPDIARVGGSRQLAGSRAALHNAS